ncbi:MAG: shikimate kinase [Ahrensia sp.]|nr:shikimate kinase [Ahrensia sp.]
MNVDAAYRDLSDDVAAINALLGGRTIALVGLMGAGKSAIGRKVALKLKLPFVDADTEIEVAAKMPVADIFESYGELEFRRLEASVIKRLMEEGTKLLATGGGAFMNADTRDVIHSSGISVWMSAELDLLMSRVAKKSTRPLLKNSDPRGVMAGLMKMRYPIYALANLEVASQDIGKDEMAAIVISHIADYLRQEAERNGANND